MEERKKSSLEKVAYWDAIETQRLLAPDEMEEKVVVLEDFKNWALIEETYWRQKSREIWLKEGDRNTRFFHKMANSRKRRNHLSKLRINGVRTTEEGTLKQDIVRAFKSLLLDPGDWKANLEGLPLSSISELNAINLEQPFSERRGVRSFT